MPIEPEKKASRQDISNYSIERLAAIAHGDHYNEAQKLKALDQILNKCDADPSSAEPVIQQLALHFTADQLLGIGGLHRSNVEKIAAQLGIKNLKIPSINVRAPHDKQLGSLLRDHASMASTFAAFSRLTDMIVIPQTDLDEIGEKPELTILHDMADAIRKGRHIVAASLQGLTVFEVESFEVEPEKPATFKQGRGLFPKDIPVPAVPAVVGYRHVHPEDEVVDGALALLVGTDLFRFFAELYVTSADVTLNQIYALEIIAKELGRKLHQEISIPEAVREMQQRVGELHETSMSETKALLSVQEAMQKSSLRESVASASLDHNEVEEMLALQEAMTGHLETLKNTELEKIDRVAWTLTTLMNAPQRADAVRHIISAGQDFGSMLPYVLVQHYNVAQMFLEAPMQVMLNHQRLRTAFYEPAYRGVIVPLVIQKQFPIIEARAFDANELIPMNPIPDDSTGEDTE